jgi:DNA invertase Pin-like site-specific DNA recombinase
MLRVYIRTSKTGQTQRQQQAALVKVGITEFGDFDPVYVNDRDTAIASLHEGDVLVVSEPSRLGVSAVDVMGALQAIGERGATVMRADTGKTLEWSPDAQKVIAFAVEAESTNRKEIAARARKVRAEKGITGGIPSVEWTPAKVSKLKAMDKAGELTRQQMADELGISRATLQRKLAELNSNKGAE